jgi:hypothetical protein
MRHPFLELVARGLAERGIGTFRYQFPYMQAREKRPDPPDVAMAAVRAAVAKAAEVAPGLPIIAGGKSFGGRMTSNAAAKEALPGVKGLVFLGFPLHPPGKPGDSRAAHLASVTVPMLFLQGTRDTLARLDLITAVCQRLGPLATLHVVEGADHSFKVLKRSGRVEKEVMEEMVVQIDRWAGAIV